MREEDLDQEIREAIDLGKRNLEIIRLAAAWCRHMKLDRRHTGVGMIEQQTGLPIGGGMFRCQYAAGTLTSGMQLEAIALGFYERYCRNCTFRDPPGGFPNLGTWAEPRLRERETLEAERTRAAATVEEARADRRAQRLLIAGALGPVARDVVEIVNALDTASPGEAKGDLVALARLHPTVFDAALADMLIADLDTHGFPGILEALIELSRLAGRPETPRLVPVAIRCFTRGVSVDAAAEYLAANAAAADLDSVEVLQRAMSLAGRGDEPFDRGPDPAPALLLRMHGDEPDRIERALGEELRHGDLWRRRRAGRVASVVIGSDAAAGPRLLPALLDGLGLPDDSKYHGDAFATASLVEAIARVLMIDVAAVDAAVDGRWGRSGPEFRQTLLRIYDHAARRDLHGAIPIPVADSIGRRGMSALGDADLEVVRRAADMLELLGRYHGEDVSLDLDALLGSVALMARRLDEMQVVNGPADPMGQLKHSGELTTVAAATRDVAVGVGHIASKRPNDFWNAIDPLWASAPEGAFREFALRMIQEVSRATSSLSQALSYLYSGALTGTSLQRAQALRSVAKLVHAGSPVPELLRDLIVGALSDQSLRVLQAAIEAVDRIELDRSSRLPIIRHLLAIAAAYAPEREHDDLVRDSMWAALHLAAGVGLEDRVADAALAVTHLMPAQSATELLARTGSLRNRPAWLPAAVHAIRMDDDSQYADLGEEDRREVLNLISASGPIADHDLQESLKHIAAERLAATEDREWAWRVAEALAAVSAYEAAVEVAEAVTASIPDTLEERYQRRLAQQIALSLRLERETTESAEGQAEILRKWAEAEAEAIAERDRRSDAGSPFFLA